jgi:hypothetical protein
MSKSMIKCSSSGNSPRDGGESLRANYGRTEDSAAVPRYKQTNLFGAGGGCTRGAAAPGKQFRTSKPLPTLQDRAGELPPITDDTKFGLRLYLYEREREWERFDKECQVEGCRSCSDPLNLLSRRIQSFKTRQGDWLVDRLECESRAIARSKRIRTTLERAGVGYWRLQLFHNRIHLVRTFDLCGSKQELVDTIAQVSALDWRP